MTTHLQQLRQDGYVVFQLLSALDAQTIKELVHSEPYVVSCLWNLQEALASLAAELCSALHRQTVCRAGSHRYLLTHQGPAPHSTAASSR